METNVQKAMSLLIETFNKYASKEGDKFSLNKSELKELLQNEFGGMLCKANDKAALDSIFNGLDKDKSGSVEFSEFCRMVCCLTELCHEYFCSKK
ncbi:ictacalcin-like [Pholidichthys leucotaenia]